MSNAVGRLFDSKYSRPLLPFQESSLSSQHFAVRGTAHIYHIFRLTQACSLSVMHPLWFHVISFLQRDDFDERKPSSCSHTTAAARNSAKRQRFANALEL